MPDTSSPVESALAKAEQDPIFTDEEIAALKRMADVWRGFEAFGRIAGFIRTVLTWIGWAVAAYIAFRAGLVDWLKSVLR